MREFVPEVRWCKVCGACGRLMRVGENKDKFAVVCSNSKCPNSVPPTYEAFGYELAYLFWNRRNM